MSRESEEEFEKEERKKVSKKRRGDSELSQTKEIDEIQ